MAATFGLNGSLRLDQNFHFKLSKSKFQNFIKMSSPLGRMGVQYMGAGMGRISWYRPNELIRKNFKKYQEEIQK